MSQPGKNEVCTRWGVFFHTAQYGGFVDGVWFVEPSLWWASVMRRQGAMGGFEPSTACIISRWGVARQPRRATAKRSPTAMTEQYMCGQSWENDPSLCKAWALCRGWRKVEKVDSRRLNAAPCEISRTQPQSGNAPRAWTHSPRPGVRPTLLALRPHPRLN